MNKQRYRGNVVLPNTVLNNAVLEVVNGKIANIVSEKDAPQHVDHDFSDCYLFPGLIDAHVHAYSGYEGEQEGLERLTKAAARGGIATIIDMPYDRPNPITTKERLEEKIELVNQESLVDVALFGTTTKFEGAQHIVPLAEAGVCAFKFSTYEADPKRFPEMPDSELIKIFKELGKAGKVAAFHAENGAIIDPLIEELRELGSKDARAHCYSRPIISETTSVLKLLELAKVYQTKLHIVHLSSPQGYDAVKWYQQQGVDVTTETCLQYLLLNEDSLTEHGALAKCNPPVREEGVRLELWNRLHNNEIDFLTSDHAPWPMTNKKHDNIFDNASGLPGVDVLFPLLFSEAVFRNNVAIAYLGRLLAKNQAERYGLAYCKGSLEIGKDADITIVDPKQSWQIDASRSESISKWSPYDGWQVQGKILQTIVRGEVVYSDGVLVKEKGYGKFVSGNPNAI